VDREVIFNWLSDSLPVVAIPAIQRGFRTYLIVPYQLLENLGFDEVIHMIYLLAN
jgi:hypothetical protein